MADNTEIRVPLETIVQAALDLLRNHGLRPEAALPMVMALLLHRLRHRAAATDDSSRIWNGLQHDPPLSLLDHILHKLESELPIEVNRPQTPAHVARRLLDMIDHSVASIPPGATASLQVDQLEVATVFSDGAPTPRSVVSLMVEAIRPRPGSTLLDPACGSGGFLLASLEHVRRENINDSLQVNGIERLSSLADLARVNLAVHGHLKGQVLAGDAFEMADTVSPQLFDYVLSNPPAAQHSESPWHFDGHPAFRFGPPQSTTDFNFIQLAVAHLKPSGSGALLVRHRPLIGGGKDLEIRRRLLQAGCITAVISLPARLLPTTSAACAILMLRAPTQQPAEARVKLIAADSEFCIDERGKRVLTADNIARIRTALASEPIEGFSVVKSLEELAKVDYDLNPASHFGTGQTPVNLGPNLVMKRIDAIASVFRGKELGGLPAGNTPILQGRDLPMRKIYVEDLKRRDVSAVKKVLKAAHGDILVQRIGESPCCYFVEPELADVAVSGTAYVIRLRQPDELTARFIVQFLNSSAGRERLRPMPGSGAPTLTMSRLRAAEIPFVDESVMRLALDLHGFESLLYEHVALAGDLKSRLFSVSRPEDFGETFRDIQLRYRLVKESLPGSGNLAALNATIGAAALEEALSVWEQHQSSDDEAFWHRVLDERPFLFAQLFHYPVVIVQDHAYVGGKRLDNRHGSVADFLAKTKTTNAALIIEIKTPCTALLGSEYRQDIYPLSRELSGALSQVLHYQSSLAGNIHQLRNGIDEHLESDMPRCVVIAGNVGTELDTGPKQRAFERWRENLHGVSVIGFDELFSRARGIFEILTGRNTPS